MRKIDPERILVSDELKGKISDLDDEFDAEPLNNIDSIASRYVTVSVVRVVESKKETLVGILRSVLFDIEPEIELKVQLSEAFDVIEANNQYFDTFELELDRRIVKLDGKFNVKAARIQEIDVKEQMCVLALHLQRLKNT